MYNYGMEDDQSSFTSSEWSDPPDTSGPDSESVFDVPYSTQPTSTKCSDKKSPKVPRKHRGGGVCRFLITLFNLLVIGSGLFVFVLGIYALFQLESMGLGKKYYLIPMCMALSGLFIGTLGLLGCYGVHKRYAFVLFIVVLVEIVCAVLFFIVANEVILSKLVYNIANKGASDELMREVQYLFSCCGAQGPSDYWHPKRHCCDQESNCTTYPDTGCNTAIAELVKRYKMPLGCGALIVAAVECFIIILTCCASKRIS